MERFGLYKEGYRATRLRIENQKVGMLAWL